MLHQIGGGIVPGTCQGGTLEKEVLELRPLAAVASHLPWDREDRRMAEERWVADICRAERRRDVSLQAAQVSRRERDDLLSACHRESPLWNCRAGASVLADFVLHFQNLVPQLPAMAEAYKRQFPEKWFADTHPLPPLTLASFPHRP
ncbi:hypothetical protein LIER_15688 [Lithospermum erythrorhizon]|uniref:Uncharacterized protein n=1 Tax=Lithospermum erythrorhizon TaxID=34254 RepID=A0AAV3Q949_LITER